MNAKNLENRLNIKMNYSFFNTSFILILILLKNARKMSLRVKNLFEIKAEPYKECYPSRFLYSHNTKLKIQTIIEKTEHNL